MEEKYMLTVIEASEYLRIGRNTLRKLIQKEKIPVIKIGKKTLIKKETLHQFIKLNEGKNLRNVYEVIGYKDDKEYNIYI